jgi:hypothetical protein
LAAHICISDFQFPIADWKALSMRPRLKSAIDNRQLAMYWMADRPRLLPITKKHLRQVLSVKLPLISSDASTVVAGRFKFAFIFESLSAKARRFLTSTHLAPSFV